MSGDLRRRWLAIFFLFGLPGLVLSSWVTRTPDFRDAIGADIATVGMILLGLSAGSMTGILLSAVLTRRWGARRAIAVSAAAMLVGFAVLVVAVVVSSGPTAFLGLAAFGWGMGASEVGINTEGTRLEALSGKALLSSLHAGFSVGTVVGSAVGFAMQAIEVPSNLHLGVALVLLVVPAVAAVRAVPPRIRVDRSPVEVQKADPPDRVDLRLILIGVAVLGMALAEGSANDWLPLVMVDGHGMDEAGGAFTYLGFATAMAVGRFAGPAAIGRFGRVAVLRTCAALAAVGLGVVILSPLTELAVVAALVWGLGASVGFPITISAAADGAGDADRRVGQVVTTGYLAFLVGPPLLGLLGNAIGLRGALVAVLVVVGLVIIVAGAVRSPIRRAVVRSSDS